MNPFVFEEKRPVVQTRQGKLRGVTYGDVNIFMGIPYAHAKRFHIPEEVETWEGIRNAYQHGPIPMQAMEVNPFHYYRGIHVLEKQSEDCQNLNIWAPKTKVGEKKPVFVWIHGGGFFGGNAYEEISFDGFRLAHDGDVIFVSINHRLNLVGFLNLEDYGEEFANSANLGLWDLVVALKWIHENISAFGGDPENVTLCGHSGGGGKVQAMMQIEEVAHCFQRCICLSGARAGTASPCLTREESRKIAKEIMDELGITRENIERVYEIPYRELADAALRASDPFGLSPVPNEFFPGFPALTHLMPFSKDKPVLYSCMLGELPVCNLTLDEKEAMSEADKEAYLRNRFGEHAEELMTLFRKTYPDHDLLDLAYMDSGYRIATVRSAQKHLEAGCENVYLFLGAYTVPENGRIPIWHGGEVAFIFMNEDKVLVLNDPESGQLYGKALSGMVLNFVRNGDPNCECLPEWKKVTREENWTMVLDRTPRCVANHDEELIRLHYAVAPKFKLDFKAKKD